MRTLSYGLILMVSCTAQAMQEENIFQENSEDTLMQMDAEKMREMIGDLEDAYSVTVKNGDTMTEAGPAISFLVVGDDGKTVVDPVFQYPTTACPINLSYGDKIVHVSVFIRYKQLEFARSIYAKVKTVFGDYEGIQVDCKEPSSPVCCS